MQGGCSGTETGAGRLGERMRLFVHMLMGGSICTMLYILLRHISEHELSLRYCRIFLRVNIAFYLLPFPWIVAELKAVIKLWLEKAGVPFRDDVWPDVLKADSIWSSVLVVGKEGNIYLATGYQKWLGVIGLAGVLFLFLILRWIVVYQRACRRCKRAEIPFGGKGVGGYRRAGRKRVRIGISKAVSGPVAVGIVRPVMLLPENYEDYADSMEGVIRHELCHISGRDMLGRFLAFLVVAFEWFNPLAHYLMKQEIEVSEMLCDEAAVEGMTNREKKSYMECLIRAGEEPEIHGRMRTSLGNDGKLIEKRIKRIMGENVKKSWRKGYAVLIMAACFVISSIPALAYREPVRYEVTEAEDKTAEKWNTIDRMTFIDEEEGKKEYLDFSRGDVVFVDEDGVVWEEDSFWTGNSGQERVSCQHSYKSGTLVEHSKKADGGCTEITYSAQKCTKCGYVVKGSRISTMTYDKCPH